MVNNKVQGLKEIFSYQERAFDAIVSAINAAKEKLGDRQTLTQLADSRDFAYHARVSLKSVVPPISVTSQQFIDDTIRKQWHLTDTFQYDLKYLDDSRDEISQYYYFQAIFSQPTAQYPIPQATASVFFRVEDKLIAPLEERGVPTATFHLEGQQSEYDIRYVAVTADWILAILQMKLKFFQRIENLAVF